MKKVLLVTDVNFWEQCSGDKTRILSLIEFLTKHVQLTVINTGPAPGGIEKSLANNFHACFYILEKNKYLNSNEYGRKLKTFLKDKRFDTIIIEYIHSSYFLNFLINDVHVILDAHDIISERTKEFKRFNYAGALYEMSGADESKLMNVYDHIMVLCQPDYEKINSIVGPGKTVLSPHPVKYFSHPLRKEVKNIAFVASAYLPNKDGIDWFIANCWPYFVAKYDVHLSIYGMICKEIDLTGADRVFCRGFVPDLNRVYESADIMINPVRFGAGLKIKNIEALAHGVPLVTTTHGSRGLEILVNKGFLVADEAGDFIHALSSLIEDFQLRKEISYYSYSYVKENLTADKCFAPILDVINNFKLDPEGNKKDTSAIN